MRIVPLLESVVIVTLCVTLMNIFNITLLTTSKKKGEKKKKNSNNKDDNVIHALTGGNRGDGF